MIANSKQKSTDKLPAAPKYIPEYTREHT